MHPISCQQYKLYYPLDQDQPYPYIDENKYPSILLFADTEMFKEEHPYHEHTIDNEGIGYGRVIDKTLDKMSLKQSCYGTCAAAARAV